MGGSRLSDGSDRAGAPGMGIESGGKLMGNPMPGVAGGFRFRLGMFGAKPGIPGIWKSGNFMLKPRPGVAGRLRSRLGRLNDGAGIPGI